MANRIPVGRRKTKNICKSNKQKIRRNAEHPWCSFPIRASGKFVSPTSRSDFIVSHAIQYQKDYDEVHSVFHVLNAEKNVTI
jgi:hypothetical protein